jgi:4-amino-4-deoxy-L-arabinose transferase-like glycosyltransferase
LAPVLFGWLLYYSETGKRWKEAAAFLAGCAVPFLPVILLLVKGPRQTFFNVVQYQALFRRVNWGDATSHDFDVFTAWINSVPSFLLALFAIFGVAFIRRQSAWERSRRAEFYLCAWVGAALTLYIATAHPTFQRYFIVAVPFFAVLAAVGFFAVTSHLVDASRPFWPLSLMSGLLVLSVGKELFDNRVSTTWATYDEISAKIAKVTPAGAQFYADEQVYFLLGKTPLPGMEFSYSHKLELSPAEEKLYHIVSEKEINAQVKAGKFATVESCKDDRIEDMELPKLFPQQQDIGDCTIFWGPMKHPK